MIVSIGKYAAKIVSIQVYSDWLLELPQILLCLVAKAMQNFKLAQGVSKKLPTFK